MDGLIERGVSTSVQETKEKGKRVYGFIFVDSVKDEGTN